MGLQKELGIAFAMPNAVQRTLQRVAATDLGTALMSKVISPLDRLAYRASKGRFTLGRSLGAMPVVVLATTGARSGLQRETPINVIPFEDDLALVGTNFGSGTTPSWAHNLFANPAASVALRGVSVDVVARAAIPTEVETVFAAADQIYPGYANYRRNATNTIPVFILVRSGSE
ncbi:MAG: nitroreductase family deazaflavin-dependent oxidoreductase [bacterium]|nr:nitroreductase family deazaflavin-dependent oxidoreductase [bacterium]